MVHLCIIYLCKTDQILELDTLVIYMFTQRRSNILSNFRPTSYSFPGALVFKVIYIHRFFYSKIFKQCQGGRAIFVYLYPKYTDG